MQRCNYFQYTEPTRFCNRIIISIWRRFSGAIFRSRMQLKIKTRRIIPALLLGAALAYLVYTSTFQRNYFSKTYLVVTLFIFIAGSLVCYAANQRWIVPLFNSLKPAAVRGLALAALLISALLLLNFDSQPLYALLPSHSLRVLVPAQPGAEAVNFDYLENSLGHIAYANLNPQGNWSEQGDSLQIQPDVDFSLEWQGKTGRMLQVVFQPTGEPRTVEIRLDDQSYALELQNASGYAVPFKQEFDIPVFFLLPAALAFLLLSTYALLVLWALLDRLLINNEKHTPGKGEWLAYALPAVLVWGLSLLVFWPGMLSNDSLGQWGQALSGQMGDWHPIFHTFLLSVLMKIWYSPALPAMLQILALSLVFARGLGLLQAYGAPRWVLWAVAVIFALFPINPLFSITLWKDIPYAIALLALFILFLRIALTSGAWLAEKTSLAVVGPGRVRGVGFPSERPGGGIPFHFRPGFFLQALWTFHPARIGRGFAGLDRGQGPAQLGLQPGNGQFLAGQPDFSLAHRGARGSRHGAGRCGKRLSQQLDAAGGLGSGLLLHRRAVL